MYLQYIIPAPFLSYLPLSTYFLPAISLTRAARRRVSVVLQSIITVATNIAYIMVVTVVMH
jgi:hypothetical protein